MSIFRKIGMKKWSFLTRAQWIILVVMIIMCIFVAWASVAQVAEITRAPGLVIASSRTQTIQSAIDGVIEIVKVREGERVIKGQVLANLERSQAEAAQNDSLGKVAALKAALVRLRAEVFDKPLNFPPDVQAHPHFVTNQTELYKRRQQGIKTEISALQDSLRLVREELELSRPLLVTGDIGKVEIIRLERQEAELTGQVSVRRNKYFQDAQAEMTKVEEEISTQQQILAERSITVGRLEVRAPVNGMVKKIYLTTQGAKVRPGEVIMELLPIDGNLIVEGKLKPSDIAFIRTDLPATVKLDAYDYSIYGSLDGKVIYVSPDAINEETRQGEQLYYRVQVKIDENSIAEHNRKGRGKKSIEVQPGMTAGIEIETGKKTLLSYVTKPVTKTISMSFSER